MEYVIKAYNEYGGYEETHAPFSGPLQALAYLAEFKVFGTAYPLYKIKETTGKEVLRVRWKGAMKCNEE